MNSIETFLQSRSSGMRHALPFIKMQALGNDFVFLHEHDLLRTAEAAGLELKTDLDAPRMARWLCDRNFAIGADGLIIVRDPLRSDCQVRWLYLNRDGTSTICGNGLRCLALYAVHTGIVPPGTFSVETESGKTEVQFTNPSQITTDLGQPILRSDLIPVAGLPVDQERRVISQPIKTELGELKVTTVSMPNPHCVIFMATLPEQHQMLRVAESLQADSSLFPEGVNVEFVCAERRDFAHVYVVERGCGPTLACGTGAAAVQVAGVLERKLDRACTVSLPGGQLALRWSDTDEHVTITGPANIAFEGVIDLAQLPSEAPN